MNHDAEKQRLLMILGAGIYQMPLIEKAKEMGLRTLCLSIPGNYPGFAAADEFAYINTTDAKSVTAKAKEAGISAVCVAGTDVAIPSLAAVCEALQLPGLSKSAAHCLSDKCAMKEMFQKGGVRTADFRIVRTQEEAVSAAKEIGFPVIIKTPTSSGSRGITAVRTPEDIAEAFELASSYSRNEKVIVEKFLEGGSEIGLDAFVANGQLLLFMPHFKLVYRTKRTGIPAGHSFPYRCEEALHNELKRQLELAIAASGADNCAINADIMIVDGKPYFIEMTGRSGATGIPELITMHTGVDYYELILKTALGEPVCVSGLQANPCMSRLIFANKNGTIQKIDREKLQAVTDREHIKASLDYKEGETVRLPENGTDRIGIALFPTDDPATADRIMEEIDRCIEIG